MVPERFELAFYRACVLLQIRSEMYEITFIFSSTAQVPLQDTFSNLIDSIKKVNLAYKVIIMDNDCEQTSPILRFYGRV